VLIPDDPEGKNRKRLAQMQEMVKSGKIKKAEYEILNQPMSNRSLLEQFSAEEIAQLKELLGTAPAAPASPAPAEPPAAPEAVSEEPQTVEEARQGRKSKN